MFDDTVLGVNGNKPPECNDVNAKNNRKDTPLHEATIRGHLHLEICELLVKHGADVNAKGHAGYTPLHWAVRWGHLEIAKILIEKMAEVNVKDDIGKTPLHRSVY